MTPTPSDPDLSARVDAARQRGFVGRSDEVGEFDDALRGTPGRAPAVLFVHGPGGIGKTTLAREFCRRAESAGRPVVQIDGRDVDPSPEGFEVAVRTARGADAPAPETLADLTRPVLIVDGYEYLMRVDRWLRDRYLPRLPAGAIVVLAGREPPPLEWRTDPGWREIVHVQPLEAFREPESAALLEAAGVGASLRPRLCDLGRGHPLALSLLADVAMRGELPDDLAAAPDLVTELLQVFVRDVPDEIHRRGLLTCAHAWVTTEDLLRCTVGDEHARAVWEWLAGLSFVVRGPKGLYAHELARDTIDADFRNRAPDAYAELHHDMRVRIVDHLHQHTGEAGFDAARQLMALHTSGPIAQMLAVGAIRKGHGGPTPFLARDEDLPALLKMVEEHEGPASAQVLARWLELPYAQPWVLRGADGVTGFSCNLTFPGLPSIDVGFDPVVQAIVEHVAWIGRPRPGEELLVHRFIGSPDGSGDPNAILCSALVAVTSWVSRPLAWAWMVTSLPELWRPLSEYLGFPERLCVDSVDGAREAYGMDWRRFRADEWLDFMEARELTGEAGVPRPEHLRPAPIDRETFARALKEALRDLRRDDRLAANPLAGTVLGGRDPEDRAASIRSYIERALAELGDEPKGERLARVLDRTYLHPAPTQEAAAEILDLPFSTYRRHLTQAIERLTDLLWSIEIRAAARN